MQLGFSQDRNSLVGAVEIEINWNIILAVRIMLSHKMSRLGITIDSPRVVHMPYLQQLVE